MRNRCLGAFVLLLLAAWPVCADQLEVIAVPFFYNGISTGIVKGLWNGNPVDLVCDDWDHTTYLNNPFEAVVSTFPDLEHVRFPGDREHTQFKHYQQAAWLLTQLWEEDTQSNIVGLQYALWKVFNPTHDFPVVLPLTAADLLAQAQNPDNYDRPYPGVRIFTDGPNQEFMTIVPAPEPSTWWLVTLGVAGLAVGRLRRRQLAHMPCYPAGRMNNRNRPITKGSPTGL